jgi:hypothetical protein
LEDVKEYVEADVLDGLYNLVHLFDKNKIKSSYQNGFDFS